MQRRLASLWNQSQARGVLIRDPVGVIASLDVGFQDLLPLEG
jgi:hypothetical protein